ncbi:MAG TPA: hypothetical protein DCS30_07235 [Rhizobiales bacterium]|nr:hypothetical protein [Hyphomicrobiales bacterium]
MPSKDKKSTPIGVMTRQLALSKHGLQDEWFGARNAAKDRTQSVVYATDQFTLCSCMSLDLYCKNLIIRFRSFFDKPALEAMAFTFEVHWFAVYRPGTRRS